MNNNVQSWQITESHEIKRIIEREKTPENIFNMICIKNDLYKLLECHHLEWYMYNSVDQSLSPGGATMGLTNTRPWILAAFIGMASLKSPFSCLLWQLCHHWVFSLFFCHHCAIDRRLNFLTLRWLEHTLGNHRVQDWLEKILSKKFLQCACPLLSKSFI